ncbi:MAG TPA: ATP synthase subunit C [Firmicutes bacterium]|nr:ATP synthase subunit C [Bacillota bacterium]
MSTVILMALPVVFLALSVWYARRAVKRGAKPSRAFLRQLASFAVVCLVVLAAPMIASAASTDAAGAANAVASAAPDLTAGLGMIAAAPAAIGATSEDPKAFGKAIIFVALGEGIALYGLLIAILILNKF